MLCFTKLLMAQASALVATCQWKTKLVLCFTAIAKLVSVNRRRLNDDSLYQKLLLLA